VNDEEGADLEVLEPLDPPEPVPAAPRGSRRPWIVAVAVGGAGTVLALALWIALVPDRRPRASERPLPRPAPTTSTVPSFGSDPFGAAEGRFAAVVDGRLWLVDAATHEVRAVRDIGRAEIVAVSGWTLLVRSADPRHPGRRYLVDGRTGASVRAADGTWFPRIGGGWWIASHGEVTSGATRVVIPVDGWPLAQVNGGFVVAPTGGGALLLWDRRSASTRVLAGLPYTRLLGGDANRIALAAPRCPTTTSPRCAIELVDIGTRRVRVLPVPFPDQFVRSAVFSTDGRRMAIWGTKGVSLLDSADGSELVTLTAARLATLPLTFTSDAGALLVLEDPEPYRQVVVLRAADGRFVRTWVSQQQLEQLVAIAGP
jgi:hypothetical protein